MSKRIVEYDRFIRSASHVNIYALLVFLSLVSRFIRSISALVSVTRSFAFYYLCAHSVSGILYVFTLLAAYTCALFCRWYFFLWMRERESIGFELDVIQNILCIPIHESERPFKFHYDFQHLDCWTALKMNTNSLYGLATFNIHIYHKAITLDNILKK